MRPCPEPVAPKQFRASLAEGLAVYDWISAGARAGFPSAGWVMPGGGPLEFGRNRKGEADFSRTLIEGEAQGRAAADGDYSSRFTPDRLSHFRESGVIEADCLICHYPGYKMDRRNAQINSRNYRWAATAGAGLGSVKGAIFTYSDPQARPESQGFLDGKWNFQKRPLVEYNWGSLDLFTPEGRLKGKILSRNVGPENCLQCHGILDAAATGTSHAKKNDAHAKAGFRCTDCHRLVGKTTAERLRHQVAPARLAGIKQAAMQTCADCHYDGKYRARKGLPARAPDPQQAHAKRFPRSTFHFTVISCTGCHAAGQGARGGYLLDTSMGYPSWFTAEALEQASVPGGLADAAKKAWKPWTVRHNAGRGEMYAAGAPRVTQWFGQSTGGKVTPLRLDAVRKSLGKLDFTTVKVKGIDGKTVNVKTIAAENDIARALRALQAAGVKNPVFVSDRVYRLEGGKVAAGSEPVPSRTALIRHDVQKKGYGSRGCMECHAGKAEFFTKARVTNIGRFLKEDYPGPGGANTVSPLTEWGLKSVPPMSR